MPDNKLHIIAFDIPYPPDYGGAIDIYYKIKALSEAGMEIYLHCFEYGRGHSGELEKLCKKVWYYPRKTGISGISFALPYIVNSRRSSKLLKNLVNVDAPILFEGVHTTYYLSHPALSKRNKIIRTHNVEHDYYRQLAGKEKSLYKKMFFFFESALLKKYELGMYAANAFFPLSITDTEYFKSLYPKQIHEFIPPFHTFDGIHAKTGMGEYCLYHGNLSHPENNEAALYLLKNVFPYSQMPSVIAGTNPGKDITALCNKIPGCTLVINPGKAKMYKLIQNAHIHVLPTFQPTGMKLKLLYALYSGRHVVANEAMIHGTSLAECCHIADSSETIIEKINELKTVPFTTENLQVRETILTKSYNNKLNAEKIIKHLQR